MANLADWQCRYRISSIGQIEQLVSALKKLGSERPTHSGPAVRITDLYKLQVGLPRFGAAHGATSPVMCGEYGSDLSCHAKSTIVPAPADELDIL